MIVFSKINEHQDMIFLNHPRLCFFADVNDLEKRFSDEHISLQWTFAKDIKKRWLHTLSISGSAPFRDVCVNTLYPGKIDEIHEWIIQDDGFQFDPGAGEFHRLPGK